MVQVARLARGRWIMVGELQYSWEEHDLMAILETDNTKLPERVGKAHAAIASRQ